MHFNCPGKNLFFTNDYFALLTFVFAITFTVPTESFAQNFDEENNGTYGRFDDDLTLSLGLGGQLQNTTNASPTFFLLGESRLVYLNTAGFFLSGSGSLHTPFQLLIGAEIRPLFPALLFTGNDFNHRFLDLWIQSWSLELGAQINFHSQQVAIDNAQEGLFVGSNFSIPLFPWSGNLPWCWLKIGARYHHLFKRHGKFKEQQAWSIFSTLEFRIHLGTHFSKLEPE